MQEKTLTLEYDVLLSCTRREWALESTPQHWKWESTGQSASEQWGAAFMQVLFRCYQHWEAVATHQQHMHILNRSGNTFLIINNSFQKYPQEKAPTVKAHRLYQLNNLSFPFEALRQNDS